MKVSSKKGILNIIVGKRKEATKYQIQYATNKKFNGAKKITTKLLKKSVKVSKGKTYYVRVRAIKTVGKWSTVKKIKIK